MAGLFSLLLHVTSFYFQCKSLFHGVPLPPSSLEYGACVVLGALCLFFCSFAALLYTCRSRRKAARRVSAGRRSPKPTSARSRAKFWSFGQGSWEQRKHPQDLAKDAAEWDRHYQHQWKNSVL
ncbi:uncharacterized protein LOC120542925 isoform X2 [Polypterus senegalus]|uniref:uncharacterized protein LOC120542925 isoform X2 n=1 Tax=Polypterus senegalus TaxID=55291 RepID=UPI00196542BD|nr:uncharacterized protein LOC120542925 isoform X2 [Polypterus senegalus]